MKYFLIVFLTIIFIACDDNSTDNPPVDKVEKELLGKWTGFVKQNDDSVYYSVEFADSEFGPRINGDLYAKLHNLSGITGSKSITQKGTIYYTFSKPNVATKFYVDSDKNGFTGTLSADGKQFVGEIYPYDLLFGVGRRFNITLSKQ